MTLPHLRAYKCTSLSVAASHFHCTASTQDYWEHSSTVAYIDQKVVNLKDERSYIPPFNSLVIYKTHLPVHFVVLQLHSVVS